MDFQLDAWDGKSKLDPTLIFRPKHPIENP